MQKILWTISPRNVSCALNLISTFLSKFLSLWLANYLLCLVGVFINRQSAFLWVLTVLPFSATFSFIRTRLHTVASEEKLKEESSILLFHVPLYKWCPFTKSFILFGDFVDCIQSIDKDSTDTAWYLNLHIETDSERWLRAKLYDKRLLQFSYCELSIYMWQHSWLITGL